MTKNRESNTEHWAVCKDCDKRFWAFGGQKFCSRECLMPTCTAPDCNKKCSNRRVKFCSDECRNAFQKKKPGRPVGSPATNTDKEKICVACGDIYVGHFNTTRCHDCLWVTCKGPNCIVKIRWAQKGHTFCSDECKQSGLGDVISKATKGKPSSLKGRKQTVTHIKNRMRTNLGSGIDRNIASKEELSLIPILQDFGYEHCGNGTFWRRWRDWTNHNPDFVNRKTKTVFEYLGLYWHQKDVGREPEIINEWRKIGYRCIILWSTDLRAFKKNPGILLEAEHVYY